MTTFYFHSYNIEFLNGKYEQVVDGLVIKSVSLPEEGTYECIASNDIATVKSQSATVKINHSKVMLEKPGGVDFVHQFIAMYIMFYDFLIIFSLL